MSDAEIPQSALERLNAKHQQKAAKNRENEERQKLRDRHESAFPPLYQRLAGLVDAGRWADPDFVPALINLGAYLRQFKAARQQCEQGEAGPDAGQWARQLILAVDPAAVQRMLGELGQCVPRAQREAMETLLAVAHSISENVCRTDAELDELLRRSKAVPPAANGGNTLTPPMPAPPPRAADPSEETGGNGTPAGDESAYRPAKEFIEREGRFPTYKAITKALDENQWIRRRKPRKNRLVIHAGDWLKYKAELGANVDPLDAPATIVDAVMETERCKAKIRSGMAGK